MFLFQLPVINWIFPSMFWHNKCILTIRLSTRICLFKEATHRSNNETIFFSSLIPNNIIPVLSIDYYAKSCLRSQSLLLSPRQFLSKEEFGNQRFGSSLKERLFCHRTAWEDSEQGILVSCLCWSLLRPHGSLFDGRGVKKEEDRWLLCYPKKKNADWRGSDNSVPDKN